jgi:hypothetical protein
MRTRQHVGDIVEITFSLTEDDYVHAGRAMLHRKPGMRAFYMFMALCVVIFVGANLTARGGPRYGRLALQLAGTIGVVCFVWYSPWFHVRGRLKSHTQAFAPQTWVFEPSGVTIRTPASKGSFQWSAVLKAVEDRRLIYLLVSEGMAQIVPKRALRAEELPLLRENLRHWLGARAELMQPETA